MATVLSADWVLPVEGRPIEGGAVAIEGGRIAAVGTAAELGTGTRYEGCAIVPGFVNAHSHLEYAVYAGFGDGLAFPPWLSLHIERKAGQEPGDALAIARLGAARCLESGITTTADYSFTGAAATACSELGLRATVYLEVFGSDPASALAQFEGKRDALGALGPGVALGVSPHAPYTCSVDVFEACTALGLPVGTHIAESESEREWLVHGRGELELVRQLVVEPTGETGTRMLAAAGLLGPHLVAAHCVHVDEEELGLLAAHDVGIAHCPRSNALLGCGIAPLAAFRAATPRVGLGTDSPASTPSFDMFEELRAAVLVTRALERRPDALGGAEALELVTLGSARALGLDAELGSLVPGKRADLAVISLDASPYVPWEDPAAAVVFGGSPGRVVATLVDGTTRFERGGFEWHALIDAARHARSRMLRHTAAPSAT